MSSPYKLILTLGLILGTLLTISSTSWFSAWAGMEINTMMFIPLISSPQKLTTESTMKYFIIQTVSSAVVIFSATIMMNQYPLISPTLSSTSIMSIQLALIMKLGAAPLHFWLPQLTEGLSWLNNLLLLTWQKLAPLILIMSLSSNYIILMSSILSTLTGSLGGLNQTSLRKIMAFSSISHMGWILISSCLSNLISLLYYTVYCLMSASLLLTFLSYNTSSITQLFNNSNTSILTIIPLLSMGGLPPLLGFAPKWLVLSYLISNNMIIISLIFILCTLISLMFYIRISFSHLLNSSFAKSWLLPSSKISITSSVVASMTLLSFPIFLLLQ